MSGSILASLMAVLGVAALVWWHGSRWFAARKNERAAYAARVQQRLDRLKEDTDYGRMRALAAAPYDHGHVLGDAMLMATVHAMDAAYGEREVAS